MEDQCREEPLRDGAVREHAIAKVKGAELFDDGYRAEVFNFAGRMLFDEVVVVPQCRKRAADGNETRWFWIAEGIEDQTVDHPEHHTVGGDSQCQ